MTSNTLKMEPEGWDGISADKVISSQAEDLDLTPEPEGKMEKKK